MLPRDATAKTCPIPCSHVADADSRLEPSAAERSEVYSACSVVLSQVQLGTSLWTKLEAPSSEL